MKDDTSRLRSYKRESSFLTPQKEVLTGTQLFVVREGYESNLFWKNPWKGKSLVEEKVCRSSQ